MKKNLKKGIWALPERLLTSRIFMSSALISIASVAGGLINFLFNIIVGRILGQADFGILYPLTSMFMILSLPAIALQYVISKDISVMIFRKDWKDLKKFLFELIRVILLFVLVLVTLLLLLMPTLKEFFHIENNKAFLLTYLLIPLAVLVVPFVSLVQSRERFGVYIGYFLASIVIKFAVGIGLVFVLSYYGVLIGMFAGQLFSFAVIIWDYRKFRELKKFPLVRLKKPVMNIRKFSRSFFYTLLSVGAFYLITYLDSVLVRHFLPESSGIYSVVNLIGKASFFLATAVSFVMLPQMAKDKKNMGKANFKAFLFLMVILAGYAVFLWLTSDFLSRVVFAGKYAGMEGILPLYGFVFIPYAIISYFVNYYVIAEKLVYSISILCGAVVQTFGIYYFHSDLIQVSLVVGASGLLILGVLVFDLLKFGPKRFTKVPSGKGLNV
jgi:O-antigen/teichoic acid export membrane protein